MKNEDYKLLCELQSKIVVKKENHNSFGKYNFRTAEDILLGVKNALSGRGSVVVDIELLFSGDTTYLEATAVLKNSHGVEIESAKGYAKEAKQQKGFNDSQLTGSAISFAKKYALQNLFSIDEKGLDPDTIDNNSIIPELEKIDAKAYFIDKKFLKPFQDLKDLSKDAISRVANNWDGVVKAVNEFNKDFAKTQTTLQNANQSQELKEVSFESESQGMTDEEKEAFGD